MESAVSAGAEYDLIVDIFYSYSTLFTTIGWLTKLNVHNDLM